MNSSLDTAFGAADPPILHIAPFARWWALPIAELWEYRELLYFFVWRDVKIRYKQTAIGAAWAVLQPFLTMLIFSLVFGRYAHISSEGLPYAIFYYSALLPWMYFQASLQSSTNIIVDNQRLITKVYFPRLALPLASVLSGLVDFGVSFMMFAALMIYYRVVPTVAIFWFPVFLLLALCTAVGVGLWLSALNAVYRDVRYVVPFLVQFWMFASPVAYPASLVPARWRSLYALNPMAGVIEGFRWTLSGQGRPPLHLVLISSLMGLVILFSGIAYFQRMETTVADMV